MLDPLSLELESAAHLEPEDKLCEVFEDGSLLVVRRHLASRVFPETGEVRELTVSGGGREDESLVWLGNHGFDAPLGIGEPSVVIYRWTGADGQRGSRPAILDPVESTIEVLDIRYSRLVTGQGFALLVEGEQRLLRIDADTGETTVLLDLSDNALDVDA